MNNLIIAALTFVMLPAIASTASAKNIRNNKTEKNEMVVEKINFTENLIKSTTTYTEDATDIVDVDYIIDEHGKPYITYINSDNLTAKQEVVKFIESATYDFNMVPGKVYSMKLTLNR